MEYKSYSFDLDDNLLTLPTLIHLKDKNGEVKKFTTLEFEKIKQNIRELGYSITENSFNEFLDEEKLLEDITNSTKAGSWNHLVECIVQNASIFAIITARSVSPKSLKKGIKLAIIKNLTNKQLQKFSKKFSIKYGISLKNKNEEDLLDIYLSLCKFYPVNSKEIMEKFECTDVSELKSMAFEEFRDYVENYVKQTFGKNTIVKVGFSDDSINHLSKIVNNILKKQGLFFYRTDNKGRNKFIN